MAKTKKTTATTESTTWSILHIFGYGATRLVTSTEKEVPTTSLTKAQALIDFMRSKKPIDSNAGVDFHVISIVKDNFGRFVPKNVSEKHYSLKYADLDLTLVEELVAEVQAFVEPTNP